MKEFDFNKHDKSFFFLNLGKINRSNCVHNVKKCEILTKLMKEYLDLESTRPMKLVEEELFDFVVSSVRSRRKMTKTRLETTADEELGGEEMG